MDIIRSSTIAMVAALSKIENGEFEDPFAAAKFFSSFSYRRCNNPDCKSQDEYQLGRSTDFDYSIGTCVPIVNPNKLGHRYTMVCKVCQKRRSIAYGSILQNWKSGLPNGLYAIWAWYHNHRYSDIQDKTGLSIYVLGNLLNDLDGLQIRDEVSAFLQKYDKPSDVAVLVGSQLSINESTQL